MSKKIKTKKVGICRREVITPEVKVNGKVIEKAVLGTLSITDGDIKSAVRSALRRLWNESVRRVFLNKVRFMTNVNGRDLWAVRCQGEGCYILMPMSAKSKVLLKNGKLSAKAKTLFEVDHLTGSPGFSDIESDLGAWTHNLFYGELRILCRDCHKQRTKKQAEEARKSKK